MCDLESAFESAAREVMNLAERPDDKALLNLYALYKQATLGDIEGSRPTGFDLVGKAKYDAWAKLKGTARDAAMQAYVELVQRLQKA